MTVEIIISVIETFQLLHQRSARRESIRDTTTGTYDKDIRHWGSIAKSIILSYTISQQDPVHAC